MYVFLVVKHLLITKCLYILNCFLKYCDQKSFLAFEIHKYLETPKSFSIFEIHKLNYDKHSVLVKMSGNFFISIKKPGKLGTVVKTLSNL